MENLVSQKVNDPNIALFFRKAISGIRCSNCGIDIVEAGQEISYAKDDIDHETPLCEDCKASWDYEADRAWEDEKNFRKNHKTGN